MKKMTVNLSNGYDILFNEEYDALCDFITERDYSKIVIVTDENVDPLYGTGAIAALSNFRVKKIVLPAGEQTKSLTWLEYLYNEFIEFGLTRKDVIIALGGGVIGDLTGFAAATFLRGVPFIQIPTSLLAQVDSSIGGKVAIDLPHGKNLVGAFYQPQLVLINTNFLKTLPPRVFSDGMAEVIKYGAINDREFSATLSSGDFDVSDVVQRCCAIKASVVEQDEFDTGKRIILNFGHTIGHAIEQYYNYERYMHGEAVAIGMYQITLASEILDLTEKGTADAIKTALMTFNLPYELDIPQDKLLEGILKDKKTEASHINLVLLDNIGSVKTYQTELTMLPTFLKGCSS